MSTLNFSIFRIDLIIIIVQFVQFCKDRLVDQICLLFNRVPAAERRLGGYYELRRYKM